MTAEEFKAERLRLALSQDAMAKRIGVSLQAVYYYETGKRKVPQPVALLLECQRKRVKHSMAEYRRMMAEKGSDDAD